MRGTPKSVLRLILGFFSAGAIVAIGLVAAFGLGYLRLPYSNPSSLKGKISDDTVIARYEYDGAAHDVTAAEYRASSAALQEGWEGEDGPNQIYLSDYILHKVLANEAKTAGITATDEAVTGYIEANYPGESANDAAEQLGITEETLRDQAANALLVDGLRDHVLAQAGASAEDEAGIEAPALDLSSDPDAPNATYGAYIVKLLGDAWDTDADTWATMEGPLYEALSDEKFTSESATYEQARLAYDATFANKSESRASDSDAWGDYRADVMSRITMTFI